MVAQSTLKPSALLGPCVECGHELAWHKMNINNTFACCSTMACHCDARPLK